MKMTNVLYEGSRQLEIALDGVLIANREYLVRIYTSVEKPEGAVAIAQQMKKLIPQAQIIGCSVCGLIHKGKQVDKGTLIVIEETESTSICTQAFTFAEKESSLLAKEIASVVAGKAQLMHVLCSGEYEGVHDFIESYYQCDPNTKMVGGIAGDILAENISGYIFNEDGVVNDGILIAAFCGTDLHTYTGVNISQEPLSPKFRLDEVKGCLWEQVSGEAANEWLVQRLGEEELANYDEWRKLESGQVILRFPLILEGHSGASRFLKYDNIEKKVEQYHSQMPEGTEFRIGYVSTMACVRESFQICNEIMEEPIESLFCYSCMFRRMYLDNCAKWELSPYEEVNLSGAFVMGEISYLNGRNEYLNGSCCLVGVAENSVFIRPNIEVYEQLNKMEEDNRDLLTYLLKSKKDSIDSHTNELTEKLLLQRQQSEDLMYRDFETGMGNYLKYKRDRKLYSFDKLCMVKIENADLIIGHLGHEAYIQMILQAMDVISNHIHQLEQSELLSYYLFNENTFFMVAMDQMSEAHFMSITKNLYEKFHLLRLLSNQEEVFVNRFVVVLEKEKMVESALNAFLAAKNIQTPFLICDSGRNLELTTNQEFQMIGVLNRAIEENGITPYFQGIYDNKEKCINRYESLMRIVDKDGTIYTPASFMDIAKKYHLYPCISKLMIEKVMGLFAERKENVSINISVYDVNSKEVQAMIFEKLASVQDASNFSFEILEDESFRDIAVLKNFITKIRTYGAKISIDDFGAGYSNLAELAQIRPDYIKIDGSIIKAVENNPTNQKLLDMIVYLGKLFGAEIVAEFVENGEIQKHVAEKEISFSQGYCFSKPTPFEDLSI